MRKEVVEGHAYICMVEEQQGRRCPQSCLSSCPVLSTICPLAVAQVRWQAGARGRCKREGRRVPVLSIFHERQPWFPRRAMCQPCCAIGNKTGRDREGECPPCRRLDKIVFFRRQMSRPHHLPARPCLFTLHRLVHVLSHKPSSPPEKSR